MPGRYHHAAADNDFRAVHGHICRLDIDVHLARHERQEDLEKRVQLFVDDKFGSCHAHQFDLAWCAIELDRSTADLGEFRQIVCSLELLSMRTEVAAAILDSIARQRIEHLLDRGPVLFPDRHRRIVKELAITLFAFAQPLFHRPLIGHVGNVDTLLGECRTGVTQEPGLEIRIDPSSGDGFG